MTQAEAQAKYEEMIARRPSWTEAHAFVMQVMAEGHELIRPPIVSCPDLSVSDDEIIARAMAQFPITRAALGRD